MGGCIGKFATWTAAAVFAVVLMLAPNLAAAHPGHATGQGTHVHEFSASDFAKLEISNYEAAIDQSSTADRAGGENSLPEVKLAASSDPLPAHCGGNCCHPGGSGCCAASCLTIDVPQLPILESHQAAFRQIAADVDGIVPSGLAEPPNGSA